MDGVFSFSPLVHVVVIPPGSPGGVARHIKEEEHMAKGRKAFGGYAISFKGCKDSVEKVFGATPIGPSVMTKKLWAYVKRKRLGKR
jgi:hypothetical protein